MTPTYSVNINRTDKRFRKLSFVLFCIAFFGFWAFYFIEPFIQVITSELFPKSLSYVFCSIILIGFLSLILMDIRRNKGGLLKIHDDAVVIESKPKPLKIYFKDLKRISFIVSTFTFKPYRIEFIYPDFQLTRVKLRTKKDFYEIMDHLYELTPEELEKHVNAFEFEEK